ncbi:MAG TPA: glycosyltransferase family 4 protein [Chthoniobacterales bacterium]|jgi:glycosyltransferase involved in cell wall biosynthesis
MKILMVNDYGRLQGGAEILLFQLREAFRKLGHDARLFTSDAGDVDAANVADYTCFGTTSRFRTLLQSANPWAARGLSRVVAEFQPDVVHVKMFLSQLSPLILPVLRNIPAVYHVVWYRPICPLGTKMLPNRSRCEWPPGLICHRTGCLRWRDWFPLMCQMKLWRRWQNVFDLIVANSSAVRQRLLAEGIGPVEVISNGLEVSEPRPSAPTIPTIAFAGRLVREKGVDVLLRAFAIVRKQIPNARLVICGDGPERASIADLIGTLGVGDAVSMLAFLPVDEVIKVFRNASVVAIPSIWEEPFGQVAIEAMMNGLPVVASNGGGLKDIIAHEQTGLLVPPGDANALATALLRILSDPQSAAIMGRAAHHRAAAHFSETQLVEGFLKIYRSICPAPKNS